MINMLAAYFDMIGLGHFVAWGMPDFPLFEDTRDNFCTWVTCLKG